MNLCRNASIAIKLSDSDGPALQATTLILIFSILSFTFDFSLTSFSLSLLVSPAGYTKQMAAVAQAIAALTYGQSDRIITAPSSSQNRAWSLLPRYFRDNYTYCMNVDIGLGTCGCLFFTVCLFICCCVCCHNHSNVLLHFWLLMQPFFSSFFSKSAVLFRLLILIVNSTLVLWHVLACYF